MSSSYTFSSTQTFTLTHAKHLASKVATDLKRIQRFYCYPTDTAINQYEAELIELLKGGYLEKVTYGFKKDGKWIEPSLVYTARELASDTGADDDPGKIKPNANVEGASFSSFLTYSSTWHALSPNEKQSIEKNFPFSRSYSQEPGINGYLSSDKSYSSGGRALDRSTVKSY